MDIGLMMGTTGYGFPTNRLAGSYTITVPGNILLNMAGYGFLAEMHGLQPAFNGLIMAIISVGHLCGQITELGLNPGKIIVDRKSTRLNSSHLGISYAVFCLK